MSRLRVIYEKRKNFLLQFIKFSLVGLVGTLIDIGLLNFLHLSLGVFVYLAATISFIAAVLNNFLMNKHWTFKNQAGFHSKSRIQFFQFVFVSVIGLLINLGIMYLLIESFGVWYNWAKLAAVIVVLFWNFFANKFWTFRVKAEE